MKIWKTMIAVAMLAAIVIGCSQEAAQQDEPEEFVYAPLASALEQIKGTDKHVILDFWRDG